MKMRDVIMEEVFTAELSDMAAMVLPTGCPLQDNLIKLQCELSAAEEKYGQFLALGLTDFAEEYYALMDEIQYDICAEEFALFSCDK